MAAKVLYSLLGALLLLILTFGCAREYSYEGGPLLPVDTSGSPDPDPDPNPWVCPTCIGNDTHAESRWSLHSGNFFYCGIIDTAIVNPERTGFTFFGPSSCSIDSGMVISIHLNGTVLNSDFFNLSTERTGFYYYDNVGRTYLYITRPGIPFRVTIDSYIHQTRMATGTFSGTVFTANGGSTIINSGKFKVALQ